MKVLWKEWQQQKWLFLVGCLAGISFPILESLLHWKKRGEFRTDIGSAVLLVCGAIYAIILSVATTHDDTKKGVDNFWQSKPTKTGHLFVTKFLLASALLLLVFLTTISLDIITNFTPRNFPSFPWATFCYTYPISLMLFAATMFLVVIIRDTAKAVLIAIWIALMLYFLPLLIGSLEWMNIFEQLDHQQESLLSRLLKPHDYPYLYSQATFSVKLRYFFGTLPWPGMLQYFKFLGFLIFASIVFLVLSVKAMKNNWRWQPGQKTIVWTIGLSAAFIFGVSMTQVGHNLQPITEIKGKPLISPAPLGRYMPESFKKGIPKGPIPGNKMPSFHNRIDVDCTKDDLMFKVSSGYQWMGNKSGPKHDDEVINHFVLQIYKFPYQENNAADSAPYNVPNFIVGVMKIFETAPVPRGINQDVLGCFISNNRLYAAYRPIYKKDENGRYPGRLNPIRFITIDISDPAVLKIVADMEISNSDHFGRGMAIYNDYCYINDGSQLLIISVNDHDNPKIVNRITSNDLAKKPNMWFGKDPKGLIWIPNGSFLIVGNKLICANSYYIVMLNLSQPLKPQVIYHESFNHSQALDDSRIEAITFKDNFLYISTEKGIYIRKLIPTEDGSYISEPIGQRRATPIEKLAGRRPNELLFHDGYLVESASGFGVLVYDVSNPTKPKRAFHAQTPHFINDIGIWNDLLYMQDYAHELIFIDIPKAN